MRLYCIYDKVAMESGPLFEAKNDLVALRMYNGVNLPGQPEDFCLYCIGEYYHSPVKIKPFNSILEVVSGNKKVEDDEEEGGD